MKRVLAAFLTGALAAGAADIVPLDKGTSWLYRGEVAWASSDNSAHKQAIQWKVEVQDSLQRGRYKAARLLGYPSELAFFDPDRKPGCHILLLADNTRVYLADCPVANADLAQVDFGALAGNDDHLVFQLPLEQDDVFGGDPKRDDTMYAWLAQAVGPARLAGIRGVSRALSGKQYELIYRTNPDHQIATWVPGVGMTAYIYSHHGTASEVDVKLIELRRP